MVQIKLSSNETIWFPLTDIAIYILLRSEGKGKNLREIGVKAARKLGLHPLDLETLLAAIGMVRAYGVDESVKKEVEENLETRKELKDILNEVLEE